ncbi:hypothetical protein B296_00035107 [Ensete ventricosum]|uniref:Uncharacterized protein n=1 Tax=Ensete ventricosum TaxID=4639 RepID=A0A427A2X2_ENSVE|nr:hypothetical protein B296_00035107 [Ensete ventricosum]
MASSPVQERGAVAQDSTKDRAKLDGTHESILCACCSTFYPSYWWNPETYIAPAALLHSNRYPEFDCQVAGILISVRLMGLDS